MTKYNRIFTIVIDSLGTGAMPDSEKFGDVGVDTLGHIAEHMKEFHIPNLQKLGIANLRPLKGLPKWRHRPAVLQSFQRQVTAKIR